MSKICIIGWYDVANAGDEAFKTVFIQALEGHELTFSNKYEQGSDVVIVGGGGVFTSNYLRTIPFHIPVYVVGVDIDMPNGEVQPDALKALKTLNIQKAYGRHKSFVTKVQEYFPDFDYCPDLAFYLDTPAVEKQVQQKLGIMFSDMLYPNLDRTNHHYRLIAEKSVETLTGMLKELVKDYRLHFIPFCTAFYLNDYRAALNLASMIPDMSYDNIVREHLTTEGYLKEVGSCAMTFSQRYHGMIFSIIMGVPFVAFGQELTTGGGKVFMFCEQEGYGDLYINLYRMNYRDLMQAITVARRSTREGLLDKAKEKRAIVRDILTDIKSKL